MGIFLKTAKAGQFNFIDRTGYNSALSYLVPVLLLILCHEQQEEGRSVIYIKEIFDLREQSLSDTSFD